MATVKKARKRDGVTQTRYRLVRRCRYFAHDAERALQDFLQDVAEEIEDMLAEEQDSKREASVLAAQNNARWREVSRALAAGDLARAKFVVNLAVTFPDRADPHADDEAIAEFEKKLDAGKR